MSELRDEPWIVEVMRGQSRLVNRFRTLNEAAEYTANHWALYTSTLQEHGIIHPHLRANGSQVLSTTLTYAPILEIMK